MRYAPILIIVLSFGCASRAEKPGPNADLLAHVQTIALSGVEGRIDHFALDAKHHRLFMAALGNGSVEVIDLSTGKVAQRIKDLPTPQGVAFAPDLNRLAVANDRDGSLRLYEGDSLKPVGVVDLKDDADNVRYDPATRRFWVGYGSGGLAEVDAASGRKLTDIKLDAHPESFQLETHGQRVFVNVPGAGHVAVVDRRRGAVIAKWPLTQGRANFPMALDEANHRLFIGCRRPARLLVLDTKTGNTVTALDIAGDTDDVFYDAAVKRIYASGGQGAVTVIAQSDADSYKVIGTISSAPGARTSFFVAESRMLYVAVPHRGKQQTAVLVYRAAKGT